MKTPVNMPLNQAAKATGRSKGTISKALKEGRLSYISKDETGYRIDPSELNRVFPLDTARLNTQNQTEPSNEHIKTAVKTAELEILLKAEQREKEIYLKQLQEKDKTIEDYRNRLTKAETTIHNQTLLLADNHSNEPIKKQTFWNWLLAK